MILIQDSFGNDFMNGWKKENDKVVMPYNYPSILWALLGGCRILDQLTHRGNHMPLLDKKIAIHTLCDIFGDESLISRSQAKYVISHFGCFQKILLDFKNINWIGPAFADEIFRVFQQDHPDIILIHINANTEIKRMISRAQNYC